MESDVYDSKCNRAFYSHHIDLKNHFYTFKVKATFHSMIFDIPMRPVRDDKRHRRCFKDDLQFL